MANKAFNKKNMLAAGFLCSLVLCLFPVVEAAVLVSSAGYTADTVIAGGGGGKLSGGEYTARGTVAPTLAVGNPVGGEYVNRTGFYNPPHFRYQSAVETKLTSDDGNITLTLPPYSVKKLDSNNNLYYPPSFEISMNKTPTSVASDKITAANNKIVANQGSWSQPLTSSLAEIAILDEGNYYPDELPGNITGRMKIPYYAAGGFLTDSNGVKYVPWIREDSLSGWALDEVTNSWVRLPCNIPGGCLDKTTTPSTLTIEFDNPGVYTLLGTLLDTVQSSFRVSPVPFRPNGPQAGIGPGKTGTESDGITFWDVPQIGSIEIYTVDGRLVRKLPISNATLAGTYSNQIKWDVKTTSGEKVASGVYIWRAVTDSNTKTGKLMVIW